MTTESIPMKVEIDFEGIGMKSISGNFHLDSEAFAADQGGRVTLAINAQSDGQVAAIWTGRREQSRRLYDPDFPNGQEYVSPGLGAVDQDSKRSLTAAVIRSGSSLRRELEDQGHLRGDFHSDLSAAAWGRSRRRNSFANMSKVDRRSNHSSWRKRSSRPD